MSSYKTYHLSAKVLSLALKPENRDIIEKKLFNLKIPWVNLISTGSNHLILPAIFLRLQEMDLLGVLPEIVAEHLKLIYEMNLERNNAIIKQSQEIALILNKADVPVLFMKGMGNIFDSLYISPGERMLQDIDILTDEKNWEKGIEALIEAGFKSRGKYDPQKNPSGKHYPRLYRDDSVACVELHRYPVGIEYSTKFKTKEIWGKKIPAKTFPSCFVMCDEHKIIHNFIHSQLEHQGHFYARIFLRNLYDQYLLSERISPFETLINWGEFPKKTYAYLEILRTTFFPENVQKKFSIRKTGYYPLLYNLFLHSRFLSIGMLVIVKIYRSYIRKPFLAIKDKKLRRLLLKHISERSWYTKQINIFRNFYKKPG